MNTAEISNNLLIIETEVEGNKKNFSTEDLRSSANIFINIVADLMWQLQEKEKMSSDERLMMAKFAGAEIKKFIRIYTGLNTEEL